MILDSKLANKYSSLSHADPHQMAVYYNRSTGFHHGVHGLAVRGLCAVDTDAFRSAHPRVHRLQELPAEVIRHLLEVLCRCPVKVRPLLALRDVDALDFFAQQVRLVEEEQDGC